MQAQTLRAFTDKKFAQEGFTDDSMPILSALPPGQKPPAASKSAKRGSTGGGGGGGGGGGAAAGSKRARNSGCGVGALPDGGAAAAAVPMVPVPTDEEIQLIPSTQVLLGKKQCEQLLLPLKSMPNADFFLRPVDPVAMNLPDYTKIITKPSASTPTLVLSPR